MKGIFQRTEGRLDSMNQHIKQRMGIFTLHLQHIDAWLDNFEQGLGTIEEIQALALITNIYNHFQRGGEGAQP